MASPFQSSIGRMMVVALFVAIDAALLRLTYRGYQTPPYDAGALMLVPAVQLALFLAFPRRAGMRPFWAGFLAAGLTGLVLYSGVRGPFRSWVGPVADTADRSLLQATEFDISRLAHVDGDRYFVPIHTSFALVVMGFPLLVFATAGGLLATRLAASRCETP